MTEDTPKDTVELAPDEAKYFGWPENKTVGVFAMTDFTREAERLKKKARKAYQRFNAIGADASCGNMLLKEISSRAYRAAQEFNGAMAALEKLDPECPKGHRL